MKKTQIMKLQRKASAPAKTLSGSSAKDRLAGWAKRAFWCRACGRKDFIMGTAEGLEAVKRNNLDYCGKHIDQRDQPHPLDAAFAKMRIKSP